MSPRIFLVDDHELFVEGLCALLRAEPDCEIIGKATEGGRAVQMAHELEPDVVVMDLSMPGMSGIEATRRICAELPAVKVLCLSMHADRGFVMGALEAGAVGYLLKDGAKDELLTAISAVMNDHVYLCPAVAGTVVDAAKSQTAAPETSLLARLTDREREVLQLLVDGETTKEIASRLQLSVKTVGAHRIHIQEKLERGSLAALIKLAIREGWTSYTD